MSHMDEKMRDNMLIEMHGTLSANTQILNNFDSKLDSHIEEYKATKKDHRKDINYNKKHVHYVQGALGLLSLVVGIFGILYKIGVLG